MYWEYSQSSGGLFFNNILVATGYSGYGYGKDNPDMEGLRNIGPIPRGEYEIQGPKNSARTGPFVLPLIPVEHDALGRSDLQVHGDSISNPGGASSGCIIVNRSIREKIWNSGIRKLVVVREKFDG